MARIYDPCLLSYVFFSRWHAEDDEGQKTKHRNAIKQVVREGWDWVHHGAGRSVIPELPEFPNITGRRENIRLAGVDWIRNKGLSFSFESRSLLDSAYVQLGLLTHGSAQESVFGSLREKVKSFSLPADSNVEDILVGRIYCLYAEVSATVDAEKVILSSLCNWHHNQDVEVTVCPFEWGWVGTPTERIEEVVVLSRRDNESVKSASWFVNFVLPRLALVYRKVELNYSSYEAMRQEMEKAERDLAKVLAGRVHGGDLKYLEAETVKLTSLQDTLAENLGAVQHRMISMETNVENMKLVLRDKTVESEYSRLWSVFGESSELALRQVMVDRSYFDSRKEEATLALNTLDMLVNLERGKIDRRLLIILGIVGLVLSLVDGFSSELELQAKIVIVVAGVIAGATAWWWRRRYCPYCNTLLTERCGFIVIRNKIKNGVCPKCNSVVARVQK
jgi:hypothetical protein